MKIDQVYDACYHIRKMGYPYNHIADYIEANIDDFIDCMEDYDKEVK